MYLYVWIYKFLRIKNRLILFEGKDLFVRVVVFIFGCLFYLFGGFFKKVLSLCLFFRDLGRYDFLKFF